MRTAIVGFIAGLVVAGFFSRYSIAPNGVIALWVFMALILLFLTTAPEDWQH